MNSSARVIRFFGIILVVASLAAYAGSLGAPFVADDLGAIAGNPTLLHFATAFSPPHTGTPVEGRPLTNASFALNYWISGNAVWSYHAVNLLIHVAASLLLFGIVRRTLSRRMPHDEPLAIAVAFAGALWWAVDPLQTESVTYLSQRAESLMGLCYFLTLYTFIRGADFSQPAQAGRPSAGPEPGASGSSTQLVVSVLFCFCGMACKEVMMTAPVLVLLYDRTFISGSFRAAWGARRAYYLALAASWLLLAGLLISSGSRASTVGFGAGVPWWAYALTQCGAVAHYLRLCLWPAPLVADYGRALGGPPLRVLADGFVVLALVIASAVLCVRRSAWGFLGAWFFLILAPTSSVVPIATEIIAEHRLYLPLASVTVGLAAVAVGGLWRWRPRAALALVFGIGAMLCGMTVARNRVYASPIAFWSDVASKLPHHPGAENNLGNLLLAEGKPAEAEAHYRRALADLPGYADANANLGKLLLREDRWPEAIRCFEAALKFQPGDAELRADLGLAAYREGNAQVDAGKLAEAADSYTLAVRAYPNLADAHVNCAVALAQLGRTADAAREFEAALALEPNAADVHNDFGGLLAETGRLAAARAQFEAALRLKPDFREAQDNLRRLDELERQGARP